MDDGDPFDLDAAVVRADAAGLTTDVEVLAVKLEGALPDATVVRRRRTRMFGGEKVVEAVEVVLGDSRFSLQVQDGRVRAAQATEVRGVVIKRAEVGLDAWLRGLAAELAEQARTSAQARTALQDLVGP